MVKLICLYWRNYLAENCLTQLSFELIIKWLHHELVMTLLCIIYVIYFILLTIANYINVLSETYNMYVSDCSYDPKTRRVWYLVRWSNIKHNSNKVKEAE